MLERIHLRIVRAVNEEGSMSKAADALCITQSAVSHSIRKLEQQIGTAIWIRDGKKLILTTAGQHLLFIAKRVLSQMERSEMDLRGLAQGLMGNLRIGMECNPCYRWLLKFVKPYIVDWPLVEVDIVQKFQFGGIKALFDYEIDLLVTPDPLHQMGIDFQPVATYEPVLVVSKKNALAKRTFCEPSDLCTEILFTYPVPVGRLDIFNLFLNPQKLGPARHKTVEDTEVMLQMVANNHGVCVLPHWLAMEYREELPICLLHLGEWGISKQIHIGRRREDKDVAYIKAFMACAKSSDFGVDLVSIKL